MQNKPQPMQASKHLRRRSAVTKSGCRCCCRCAKTAQYISASGDIFYINVVQDAFIYARTATIVPTREREQTKNGQGNEPTVCCLNRGAHANIKSGFFIYFTCPTDDRKRGASLCVYCVHEIILTVDSATDRALWLLFLSHLRMRPIYKSGWEEKSKRLWAGSPPMVRCESCLMANVTYTCKIYFLWWK